MEDWRPGDKVVCINGITTRDQQGEVRLETDRIYTVATSRFSQRDNGVGIELTEVRSNGVRLDGQRWRSFPSAWFRPVKRNLCKQDDSIPADEWFTRICRNRLPVKV